MAVILFGKRQYGITNFSFILLLNLSSRKVHNANKLYPLSSEYYVYVSSYLNQLAMTWHSVTDRPVHPCWGWEHFVCLVSMDLVASYTLTFNRIVWTNAPIYI